jgi:hypothetical protein
MTPYCWRHDLPRSGVRGQSKAAPPLWLELPDVDCAIGAPRQSAVAASLCRRTPQKHLRGRFCRAATKQACGSGDLGLAI